MLVPACSREIFLLASMTSSGFGHIHYAVHRFKLCLRRDKLNLYRLLAEKFCVESRVVVFEIRIFVKKVFFIVTFLTAM